MKALAQSLPLLTEQQPSIVCRVGSGADYPGFSLSAASASCELERLTGFSAPQFPLCQMGIRKASSCGGWR